MKFMFRFIWGNWRRRRERFLLLIIGVLIISAGLSYLVGLSQSQKGTVVDSLQKEWVASYDIAVRPPDTRSITEDRDLLEPNYLSGIAGGISLEQYEIIKKMDNVDVAAPISMIGYLSYGVTFKDLDVEDGIYSMTDSTITDTGAGKQKVSEHSYFPVGSPFEVGKMVEGKPLGKDYGLSSIDQTLGTGFNVLVAGIDPEAEARLVGLDKSIIDMGKSRYFQEGDDSKTHTEGFHSTSKTYQITELPILVSSQEFVDQKYTFEIDKLDLPFSNKDEKYATYEKLKKNGGKEYLKTVDTADSNTYTYDAQEGYHLFLKNALGIDSETGVNAGEGRPGDTYILWEKPSPLRYMSITSPFTKRWPYAYEAIPYEGKNLDKEPFYQDVFRPIDLLGTRHIQDEGPLPPRIAPYWVGSFDPGKLNISQDPLNELPMETYRPASADLVLDQNKQPVNPPTTLKPTMQPFGFLTKPPQMLTTIDAAANILGDKPISAIRIKVAGVEDMNETSQLLLEKVAEEIEKKTGLITDITLGSSPQPTLTHIPKTKDSKELGWFEQPWVKLGSTTTIFDETKVGFSGVAASVIATAIVYVFASNIVSLLARRKEFAVLLAIGWRPVQLSKLITYESVLLGIFASLMAWVMLFTVHFTHGSDISTIHVLLIGIFGLSIYGLGAIIPAFLAGRIAPYEAMNTGEISQSSRRLGKTRGVMTMSLNYLFGKFKRNLLSIIAIALPTSLLSFFIFITFRLKGVMYTTWLGQYTAMEVGLEHYIAMGVALLISILTTAEIMWQNVSERKPELALLKAIGWRNGMIRRLIITEGILTGVLAGLLGIFITLGMIWGMYREFPYEHIGFILATGIVPVIAGLLGSIPPAENAVHISPSYGVGEK
jgi:ABC-type antimicrobial peptide transport system permease subunit